jgi:hypothetical protein
MSQVREIAWLTSHKLEAALRIREWREHTKAPVGALWIEANAVRYPCLFYKVMI